MSGARGTRTRGGPSASAALAPNADGDFFESDVCRYVWQIGRYLFFFNF
jgi:hypothetical protein